MKISDIVKGKPRTNQSNKQQRRHNFKQEKEKLQQQQQQQLQNKQDNENCDNINNDTPKRRTVKINMKTSPKKHVWGKPKVINQTTENVTEKKNNSKIPVREKIVTKKVVSNKKVNNNN